jgi:transposase
MLAACDADCDIVLREEDGTVDTERFVLWIVTKLCPMLGRYDQLEKRSVVVLDNATIHHDDRVVDAIEATGALVIYTAPYSPDLNPIEWMFAQYKKAVMRYDKSDWAQAQHVTALHAVTPGNTRAYYRRCGVPGAEGFEDNGNKDDNSISADVAVAAAVAVYSQLQAAANLYKHIFSQIMFTSQILSSQIYYLPLLPSRH